LNTRGTAKAIPDSVSDLPYGCALPNGQAVSDRFFKGLRFGKSETCRASDGTALWRHQFFWL